MNNVNIIENGQQINVDLIAYFNNNNKNYIFYSKNESVQNGLIKMYVASQNNGMTEIINDDEWADLKKVMQDIIMGNSRVNFINYNAPITLNQSKAIALKTDNISTIKNAYISFVKNNEQSGGTNKDLLAQSFGGEASVSEPVQITSIPNVQNNFNMEATPVNLNTTSNLESTNSGFSDINNSTPIIEPISGVPVTPDVTNLNAEPLTINNIKPMEPINNTPVIDNGFKVSNEPNIFDQPIDNTISPFNITQEEVNKPLNDNSIINNDSVVSPSNLNNSVNDSSTDSDVKISNVKEKIELNERKIKLFEELANIYKEENQLLKDENNENLEKTASNLFNNNGTLNEFKVLES